MSSEVHFLNVGQADAIVTIDAGSALIVDCPHAGVDPAARVLDKIDLAEFDVIVTHQDLDHCGGIHELLRKYGNASTTLYMNPVARPIPPGPKVRTALLGILSALDEIGGTTEHAVAGRVGSIGGIEWSVLSPPYIKVLDAALLGSSANRINRTSAVLALQVGEYRFLIPGDIDDTAVNWLLTSGAQLSADVLLLPHHGAKLKLIDRLLGAVNPKYVVISSGRRKTHPNISTLMAAASYGCRLMCTQATFHCNPDPVKPDHCAGSIVFTLRGKSLSVDPTPGDHRSRIQQLTSPVCLRAQSGPPATDVHRGSKTGDTTQ